MYIRTGDDKKIIQNGNNRCEVLKLKYAYIWLLFACTVVSARETDGPVSSLGATVRHRPGICRGWSVTSWMELSLLIWLIECIVTYLYTCSLADGWYKSCLGGSPCGSTKITTLILGLILGLTWTIVVTRCIEKSAHVCPPFNQVACSLHFHAFSKECIFELRMRTGCVPIFIVRLFQIIRSGSSG